MLDAKLKIRKLLNDMPDPGRPMPMAEPALVMGISDAELFHQGCKEYCAVFEELLDAVCEVDPGLIPEFDVPKPKTKEAAAGTIYSFPVPKHCGVDKKIAPSLGLSDSVAVVALSRGHAQRLLSAETLTIGGVLANANRPRAAAFLLDFAGLIEAARPWAELAARQVIEHQMSISDDSPGEQKAQAESIVKQMHTVLDVLKVLRNVTVETRFEGGVRVTRAVTEIRDIE